jgi:hypothetical protein
LPEAASTAVFQLELIVGVDISLVACKWVGDNRVVATAATGLPVDGDAPLDVEVGVEVAATEVRSPQNDKSSTKACNTIAF